MRTDLPFPFLIPFPFDMGTQLSIVRSFNTHSLSSPSHGYTVRIPRSFNTYSLSSKDALLSSVAHHLYSNVVRS